MRKLTENGEVFGDDQIAHMSLSTFHEAAQKRVDFGVVRSPKHAKQLLRARTRLRKMNCLAQHAIDWFRLYRVPKKLSHYQLINKSY